MFFIYLLVNLVVMSLAEYVLHRWFMHQPWPWRHDFYQDHAVGHHGRFYRVFNVEPDPLGRSLNIDLPVSRVVWFLLPLSVCAYWSVSYYLALCVVVVGHSLVWTALHREMHQERGRWFYRTAWYRYIAYYHYLHHCYPHRNFNAALPPLGDWLFGTRIGGSDRDRNSWRELVANRNTSSGLEGMRDGSID